MARFQVNLRSSAMSISKPHLGQARTCNLPSGPRACTAPLCSGKNAFLDAPDDGPAYHRAVDEPGEAQKRVESLTVSTVRVPKVGGVPLAELETGPRILVGVSLSNTRGWTMVSSSSTALVYPGFFLFVQCGL